MLKKHMATCLVATALAAAPAFAQTPPPPSGGTDRPVSTGTGSTTTGSPAMQPGTGSAATMAPATPAAPSSPAPSGSMGQFMTQVQPDQVMVSKLIGTTVVGPNNESIGDVNDVIVDRKGQAMAVVIGVGGFLGIGEKDVAVPFQQLEFGSARQMNQQAAGNASGGTTATSNPSTTTSANNATNTTVNTTGSTGSAQQDSATNRSTASTGNTGNAGSGAGATGADGNTPDRIMLRMTKAELQAAPTFSGSNRNQNAGGSGNAAPPKP